MDSEKHLHPGSCGPLQTRAVFGLSVLQLLVFFPLAEVKIIIQTSKI